MLWCSRLLLVAALCVAAAAAADVTWKLPPLDGELAGELDARLLGGAPRVKWRLEIRTEKPGERRVEFAADGYGLKLRGEARLDPAAEGSWRITEAEIDLGVWLGWVLPHASAEMNGVTGGGKLTASGEGTWRGGALGGKAWLSIREGVFDDPVRKLRLEGISVDIEMVDLARLRTAPAQIFTWRSGRYDVVPLGVGRIELEMDAEQVRVTSALIDVLGGELQVGSLMVATQRPEFSVDAKLVGVSVEQFLFLLPPVLSEARGKLDGSVSLRRDARGVQIGNSHLALREGETAELRLAVKPGWLTTSLPPEIVKHFPAYQKIERGEIPLLAQELEVALTPAGDAQGRTGWVRIKGGPRDRELTAPMIMNIDIRGPLEELVKIGADLGTDPRLRFGGGK